ncbi:hypothetical protein MJT46_012983 [Ovis ammon polii x Ovis aries]|nr:hypothetical protein MJT46_012983 [Ovis ammon polii x Ovis aries]
MATNSKLGSPVSFLVCFINALFLNVTIAWILFYLSQSFQYPVPWEKCPLLENASGFGEEEVKDEKRGNREISAIYNVNVWRGAGNQVLCSLGLGFGSIVSIASHIQSSSSCLSDAVIVAVANLISMLLVTPFIFSILGFWATQLTHRCNEKNTETLLKLVNMGILPPEAQPPQNLIGNPTSIFTSWFNSLSNPIKKDVLSHVAECNLEEQFLKIKGSTNFVFLAFIEAMSFIPGSVFWSFLFFVMLLNLEMSTMIGIVESIITSLQDIFISVQKYTKLFTGTLTYVCIPINDPDFIQIVIRP